MAWNDNQDGVNLANAWEKIRAMLNTWIPQHQQQLRDLAERPHNR